MKKINLNGLSLILGSMLMSGAACAADCDTYGAADREACSLFVTAREHYEARADLSKNEQAIAELDKAANLAVDSDLKYDILVLASRAIYWRGINFPGPEESNAEKEKIFNLGKSKAEAAIKINDDYADAHYYAGINFSRWGLAKGIIEAGSRWPELRSAMERVIARDTKSGDSGDEIDGYGPHRVLGRAYYKLLPGLGRNDEESRKELFLCYSRAKYTVPLNSVFYAQTLGARFQKKSQAIAILQDLLRQDPERVNPSRVPENKLEFEEARSLLDEFQKEP